MLKIIFWILFIIGFLLVIDRLLLYLEIKGWIYYRRKKPSSSALSNACLEVQQLLEPSKKHVVEIKKDEKRVQQEAGEPPQDLEENK